MINSIKPLVSIIVPVFRAELFINQCIQSVLKQTYENWELLLIDDGSPDNCPAICDSWAVKDSRIHVFHKQNGGASSARNVGLSNMTGDLVTFLDSDDCITPNCLTECVKIISEDNLDILQFYFLEIYTDGRIIHHNRISTPVFDKDKYIKCGLMSGCSCGGFYNAEIIRIQKIRYNENLHYLEDAFFVCEIVKRSMRMRRISAEFYEYHKNPEGSDIPKNWDFYLDSIEYGSSYKKQNPIFGVMIDGWCTMLAMRYITLAPVNNFHRFAQAWRALNVSNEYLNEVKRRDVKFFNTFQRLIGVRIAALLTKFVSEIFHSIK